MTDVRDLIAKAKRRESVYRLCLAGDLVAEHQALEAELDTLMAAGGWTSAADDDENPTVVLAAKILDVQQRMADQTVDLRLRALKRADYEALLEAHPPRDGNDEVFNGKTLLTPLLAACLVDPEMTEREVDDLLDVLNEGQRQRLGAAAIEVNLETTTVPFSERASAVTRWREQSKKSHEPTASDVPSSCAGRSPTGRGRSPSTTSTPTPAPVAGIPAPSRPPPMPSTPTRRPRPDATPVPPSAAPSAHSSTVPTRRQPTDSPSTF